MAISTPIIQRSDSGLNDIVINTLKTGTDSPGTNYSASVWGSYIPLSEGYRAVTAVPLWAGTPFIADERDLTQYIKDSGVMSINYRAWTVKRPCAFALGKRLNPTGLKPFVRRLWVDGQLVYSQGNSVPVRYNNFNQIYLPAGQYVNGIWVANNAANATGNTYGDAQTIWSINGDGSGAGMVAADPNNPGRILGQTPVTSSITFRFHDGSEDQLPDQAIAAAMGSDALSYRGLMYIVIDDLVCGQGSSQQDFLAPDVNVVGATKTGAQVVATTFPVIRVELVDGQQSVVYDGSFIMKNDEPGMSGGSLVPNWDTGEIISITPKSSAPTGGYIERFDIDSKNETTWVPITGALTADSERIGGGLSFWDTVHDFYVAVTGFSNHRSLVSISKAGAVINGAFVPGFDLGYFATNTNPVTDTNPADGFPHFSTAGSGYAIVNGNYEFIVFGGSSSGHCAAVHFNADGTFSNVLYPQSIIDVPAGYTFSDTIKALPLWVHATQDQHLSYQDACFVHSYGNTTSGNPGGARLVFVGIDGNGRTRIKGTQTLFTGSTPGSSVTVMLDAAGNILFQEEKSGIDPVITHKVAIDYLGAPDFSVAPGWRGLFPRILGAVTKSTPAVSSMTLAGGDVANVNNNDFVRGGARMNLDTLQIDTIAGFSTIGLWDSQRQTVYYIGGINEPTVQSFIGQGLRWVQVISGLNGGINKLSDVLKDIALAAGFVVGQLNIDASLTAGVPGVLITSPTDLGSLFNSMGAIYEFAYFNSGGKLTFRSSTNVPTYATGTVWFSTPPAHVNAVDGDTVTIGTVTYRFKNTPSAPFDVQIAPDTSTAVTDGFVKTLGNLYAAIKGDSALGGSVVPFFAGTVQNAAVTVKPDPQTGTNYGYYKLIITSAVGGGAGNAIALSSVSGGRVGLSGAHLSGGSAPPGPSVSLTLANLCHVGENQITDHDALVTTIPPPGQAQVAAAVTYYALEQDYQPLTQTFTPDNLGGVLPDSSSTATYSLPIVMSTSEAYARVSHIGLAAASDLIVQTFRLPQAYLLIEPNDVLSITIPPFQYTVRVDEATFNGDFSMSISATNFSARTDVPINNSDSQANLPQTVPNAGDALPLFIDAPILNVLQGTFAGAMDFTMGVRPLFSKITSAAFSMGILGGADPVQLFITNEPAKWGKLGSVLPTFNYPGYVIEETSITILCRSLKKSRDLQSATSNTSFIAGENCIAVGRPGNWEYIFFRDVTGNDSAVTLTGLIRAQRGTDVAAANHTPDDYVVLCASANPNFKSGFRAQSMASAQFNLDYVFAVAGQPATKPPFRETDHINGYSLAPFAPTWLQAALLAGNDLGLSWTRRDRLSTTFVTSPALMSETSEKYDLEILNGTTVVRTLTGLTTPAYTYTSAQQVTDGFTPPLATIKFRVYQKGELGRGFPRMETVNVH